MNIKIEMILPYKIPYIRKIGPYGSEQELTYVIYTQYSQFPSFKEKDMFGELMKVKINKVTLCYQK